MSNPAELESLYQEAQSTLKVKNYDRATYLLKQILVIDENYKDASRLLAQIVKLKRRRWYKHPRTWGIVGGITLIVLLIWIGSNINWEALPPRSADDYTDHPSLTAPLAITTTPVPLNWKRNNLGQFIQRGEITAIVVDPKDPEVIYVGTRNAGVYKTINGGISWQPAHLGLQRAFVDSLVVDPRDTKILYAGIHLGGIYKTTGGGQEWLHLDVAAADQLGYGQVGCHKSVVALDPTRPQHIFWSGGCMPIFESQDGGESWVTLRSYEKSLCPSGPVISIAINPLNSQNLLVSHMVEQQPECVTGIYRTVDGGENWIRTSIWTDQGYGIPVVFGIDGQEEPYALALNFDGGIYRTTDDGATWVEFLPDKNCTLPVTGPGGTAAVVCNNGELVISTDGGTNWISRFTFQDSAIAFYPLDAQIIYAGGMSGIYASTDGGQTWSEQSNGMAGRPALLRLDGFDPGNLYLEETSRYSFENHTRLFRSTDGGQNWELFSEQGSGLAFDADGRTLYRSRNETLWRSEDDGHTWKPFTLPALQVNGIFAHPSEPGMIFAAYSNDKHGIKLVYKSSDWGTNWRITTGWQFPSNFGGLALYFSQGEPPIVYAASFEMGTPYRSVDGGETWDLCAEINTSLGNSEARLAIDPLDGNRIFLASQVGVLSSQDGCRSWEQSNSGLTNLYVNTIAIDPNHPETLYAGTDGGAYVSFNRGQTWGEINDGLLGALVIYSIAVDKDSTVYAATPYGIFILEGK